MEEEEKNVQQCSGKEKGWISWEVEEKWEGGLAVAEKQKGKNQSRHVENKKMEFFSGVMKQGTVSFI